MDMSTEGPAALLWMNEVFTRVKYGHPDYRDRKDPLSLEEEMRLAMRRTALLQQEHCASWCGNKREASR